ncbi:MAG: M20/M25/M40 family metallo-hydrolase [Peptostreptococcaceae bacterium]
MIKNKKKIIALLAAGVIASPTVLNATVFAQDTINTISKDEQKMIKKIEKRISKKEIIHDMNNLVIGDNARVAGFDGEEEAAKYLAREFKKLGLEEDIEDFDIDKPLSVGNGYLNLDGESLFIKTFNGGSKISDDFRGEVVYAGFGTQQEIENLGNVEGKILLMERGEVSSADKATNASKAGAVGALIFNNSTGAMTGSLGDNPPDMPIIGMSKENGTKIISKIENGESVVLTKDNFDIDIEYRKSGESYNVIGKLKAAKNPKKAKTIVLGAHFDSVSSPGASDNASGTAVIVEVARLLSKPDIRKNLNYNIEFVAFGGEELGLLGSKEYVEELKEDKRIKNIEAMINLDMVGVGDYINTFNLKNSLSSSFSQLAAKHIKEGNGVYGGSYTNMSSSDHAPFEEAGIPSTLVQTAPDPNYHTENDTMEHIDKNNLFNVATVVARMIIDMQDGNY